MGIKPSNNFQSDRPESGGADRDMEREKSGLLDLEKQKFAVEEQEKRAAESNAQRETADRAEPGRPASFSIDNPRNPDPENK
jgi:hypothetical protein